MLFALDALEGDALEMFEDYAPRRLYPRARLDRASWDALRDPEEDAEGGAIEGARSLPKTPPIESTRGYDSAALAWAAHALGSDVKVEVKDPELPPRASLDGMHRMFMLRERLFFAGREATAFFGPHYELRRFPSRELHGALHGKTDRDLQVLHRAMARTRVRAGVLVCGEPHVAHQLLVSEGAGDDELAALAAFVVSPLHHRLRKELGVAIGTGADVETAPPTPPTPRTDDELRAAVGAVPCEKCGAPLARLDVFRVKGTAILAGKCSFCGTTRKITMEIGTSTAPSAAATSAPPCPPPPPQPPAVEAILRALIVPANSPQTVGALFDVLGIALAAGVLEASGSGTIVMPRGGTELLPGPVTRITARYAFDATRERPVATLAALRERRLLSFAIVCVAKTEITKLLEVYAGTPAQIQGARGDDYRTYGQWVYTTRSCVLAWFATFPEWLRATPVTVGAGPRIAALRELLDTAKMTSDLDALATALSGLRPTAGVAVRREQDAMVVGLVPAIPAKVLANGLVWTNPTAVASPGGWVMRRVGGRDEAAWMPMTYGAWTVAPRLDHAPGGGVLSNPELHVTDPIDVIGSMRISLTTPAAVSRENAIVSPPSGGDVRERALADLAAAVAGAHEPGALARIGSSVPAAAGILHRAQWSSQDTLTFELAPPVAATELARILRWQSAVGYTQSVHQDSWRVGLAAGGTQAGLQVVAPRLGRFFVVAPLDGRPSGPAVGRLGPAPVLGLGTSDVVRWLRFEPA